MQYNNEIADKTPADIDRLVRDNIGLVKKIVRKFKPRGHHEYEEMMQYGTMGLWKGIKAHDPNKGKLTTIAYRPICWEILLYLRNKKRAAKHDNCRVYRNDMQYTAEHVKENLWEVLDSLDDADKSLIDDLINIPAYANIAAKRNITTQQLKCLVKKLIDKVRFVI